MKKIIFFGLLLLLPSPLWAVDTVKSPLVEEGKWETDYKGSYAHDSDAGKDADREMDFGAGYGVTERWKTQVEAAFERTSDGDLAYEAFKWKNTYNLNGKAVQDEVIWALYQEIAIADRSDSSHSFEVGILARRDFGKWAHTGNLLFEREFGSTAGNGLSFSYRWQTKYALDSFFQPGFEIIGDTETNDAFRDQDLQIGPVFSGHAGFLGVPGLGYEVGYLFGVTPASHDGMLKWRLKYAF